MRSLILVFALLLAGCGGGSNPTPAPSQAVVITMNPGQWMFQFSPGMPTNPISAGSGWQFQFPPQDGVHYLVALVSGRLVGNSISTSFSITKDAATQFTEVQPCDTNTNGGSVRLFFQQRGDNLSGVGAYEFYRWWSRTAMLLSDLPTGMTTAIDPSQWSSVYGKSGSSSDQITTAGFYTALADVQAIGMTFGGCFGGHGVFVTGGNATMAVTSYNIQ